MARPRQFDEQTALKAAMSAFWSKGYEGTSLSDLMLATGLQKGSLYGAFGDKRQLYLKALETYEKEAVGSAVALLAGSGTPADRLRAFLDLAVDPVAAANDRRGCFLCNASTDRAHTDPEISRRVQAGYDRLRVALGRTLTEMAAPAPDQDARLLLAGYFGLRVMAKGGSDAAGLQAARDRMLRAVGAG